MTAILFRFSLQAHNFQSLVRFMDRKHAFKTCKHMFLFAIPHELKTQAVAVSHGVLTKFQLCQETGDSRAKCGEK